jgi:uncharacterized membrane protein YgdD (TMEM256/DUF423 family)
MNRFQFYAAFAALLGGLSVAAAAFGQHHVNDPHAREQFEIAARYQFMHAMATIAALVFWRWGATRARFAPPFFLASTVIFSGSLYAMALGGPPWLGYATPLGGIGFWVGWGVLVCAGLQLKKPD